MPKTKEPARKGRPPTEINLDQLKTCGMIHCTHEEIAAFFNCTRRTIIKKLKKPEVLQAFEDGKLLGRVNLKRNSWRLAQAHGSSAVNMTIYLRKQWLGETDKSAVELNPVELVITRIEHVIVDCSSDQDRQGVPALIEAQAVQGR